MGKGDEAQNVQNNEYVKGNLFEAIVGAVAIENGARYIKVLLFEPNLMPKAVLKSICSSAHGCDLKVAVHATSVKAEKMAIECGADISAQLH